MLAKMSWHSNHLACKSENAPQMRIGDIHARFRHVILADLAPPATPYGACERGGDVFRQAHGLAHLPDRHARAIVNDGGAQAGAIPSILPVNVLDDFLSPLMLEIDIDIGRLAALLGKKPVEQ